jgi:hypothetical protein
MVLEVNWKNSMTMPILLWLIVPDEAFIGLTIEPEPKR